MAVQNRSDNKNVSFVLGGNAQSINDATIAQDLARVDPLVFGTVMAQVAADQKWVPLTDIAAIDGTATPAAIFIGQDIPAADIVAGDVELQALLVGSSVQVDKSQVVLENSLVLSDLITAVPWASTETIQSVLHMNGIDVENTEEISSFENS